MLSTSGLVLPASGRLVFQPDTSLLCISIPNSDCLFPLSFDQVVKRPGRPNPGPAGPIQAWELTVTVCKQESCHGPSLSKATVHASAAQAAALCHGGPGATVTGSGPADMAQAILSGASSVLNVLSLLTGSRLRYHDRCPLSPSHVLLSFDRCGWAELDSEVVTLTPKR